MRVAKRFCFLAALSATLCGLVSNTWADGWGDFAPLHAAGRYFGYGYTKSGYHSARDGRLNIVTATHPAYQYGSQNLLHPYHVNVIPYYHEPQNSSNYFAAPIPQLASPDPKKNQRTPAASPAEDAPDWLKPMLKQSMELPPPGSKSPNPLPEPKLPPDVSPSDRLDSPEVIKLPESEESRSDSNDLLLLDEGDLSYTPTPQAFPPGQP